MTTKPTLSPSAALSLARYKNQQAALAETGAPSNGLAYAVQVTPTPRTLWAVHEHIVTKFGLQPTSGNVQPGNMWSLAGQRGPIKLTASGMTNGSVVVQGFGFQGESELTPEDYAAADAILAI